MAKSIHHTLSEQVLINSREGQSFLEFNDLTLTLPKTVQLEESSNATLSVDLDFEVVISKNGSAKIKKSSMSLESNLKIKVKDQDLNLNNDNGLIALYELNDGEIVDRLFNGIITQLLTQGFFNDQIEQLSDNWSEEEAKIAFDVYKFSKKVDSIGVDALIDDLIKKGKIDRTKAALKFKLANFKNLESGGDEGLDNIGQVFIKVFNEHNNK